MKKVLFDLMVAQPVGSSKFHGGGEYTKKVFGELVNNHLENITLTVFYDEQKYLDEWIKDLIQKYHINVYCTKTYADVAKIIDNNDFDVFFAGLMNGVDLIPRKKEMKVIGVYHGFRTLEMPIDSTSFLYEENLLGSIKAILFYLGRKEYVKRKYLIQEKKLNACDIIVGVSEHSGSAARVFFPKYNSENIRVFYSPEKNAALCLEKDKNCGKYILMLGGNRWVKNTYRGIIAIDELFTKKLLSDYRVEIVGGIPKLIYKKIKNKSKFISCNYLSTEELEKKYKTCDIFFYPTLNEGFGYPPEEAMKYGQTCIISGINSLIEVYGDACYYCNPYDLNEMQCRLIYASEHKIEKEIIANRYELISNRQKEDLRKLCTLISQEE